MDHLLHEAREHSYDESFVVGNPRIVVVGCGGAGSNSVHRLHKLGIEGATTYAINTDKGHLDKISADKKLLIGQSITRGLGCGGDPAVGRRCADLAEDEIREAVRGADLTFMTVGMGGGTGTAVAPMVARLARSTGSLVVSLATTPFLVERRRRQRAREGLEYLRRSSDCTIILDNERLLSLVPNLSIEEGLSVMDQLISEVIKGLTETIVTSSLINLDFNDVRTILKSGGTSTILYGEESYTDPDLVVEDTLNNPLYDADLEGATGALIHITSGPRLTLRTAYDVVNGITAKLDPNANVIIGARVDPDYEGVIKVMTIITGVKSPPIIDPSEGLVRVAGDAEVEVDIPIVR
jgi:cell division protein FtsZ